uniref:Coiled-coil domain-containing protein 181 n=1 Tax=Anopheles albimanus TaxID=7167 RepID=A0A182FEM8_ANOAL
MIDDDEEDYEGYFLRPANEYNIKEKIIQANQESFAIPTPPSPRHHGIGERRVTFREQLVDYEPDEYSSEDDGYGGGGGGGGGTDGGSGVGRKRNAVIETVADVHRDADSCSQRANNGGTDADTIIEELHLDERNGHEEEGEGDEEVVEEEQLEYDEDDENGIGAGDRIEKHKTGVEAEPSDVVSEEDYGEEEIAEGEDILEEGTGVEGEQDEEEEEEEEPTDGSSMDTEIHNPASSEEISSSPLKTYRSEADSRSGSGDSQAEDGASGGEQQQLGGYEYDDHYEDDDEPERRTRNGGRCSDEEEEDQRPPLESHRAGRSVNCRRKCCRHKKSKTDKLPYYNGFRSEYGLSREELEEKTRRLEARRKRVRERQQRRTAEQRQKAQSNEEAFAAWLHGKLRSSINKHQNMYDVRHQSTGGQHSRQQQQQQLLNPIQRRRNAIHAMHQISYG